MPANFDDSTLIEQRSVLWQVCIHDARRHVDFGSKCMCVADEDSHYAYFIEMQLDIGSGIASASDVCVRVCNGNLYVATVLLPYPYDMHGFEKQV